eukprot:9165790-Pyramimonas_sp.AAC.2
MRKILGVEVGKEGSMVSAPGLLTVYYLVPKRRLCFPWAHQPHGLKLKKHVVNLTSSEDAA